MPFRGRVFAGMELGVQPDDIEGLSEPWDSLPYLLLHGGLRVL
jgi:hypothetical protein